jgi:hypothetical protein
MGGTRVLIIANPAAEAVTPALVWELVRVCRRQVRDVSVRWTTAPGEATRIARKVAESAAPISLGERALAGVSPAVPVAGAIRTVVAAVGGNGTVREVAAGLASAWQGSAPTPLLTVPLHDAWQSTVELTLGAREMRWLDLARVAGRLVFAGASAGPCAGRVIVDGRLVHSGLDLRVDIGGSDSSPDDGLLDVRVLEASAEIAHERCRQVRIERTDGQPLRFEHDGEVLPPGPSEYTVDIAPAAVPMLAVPALAVAV